MGRAQMVGPGGRRLPENTAYPSYPANAGEDDVFGPEPEPDPEAPVEEPIPQPEP